MLRPNLEPPKEYNFYNLVGSNLVELETKGLVCNFMWFLQRADVRSFLSSIHNYALAKLTLVDGPIELVKKTVFTKLPLIEKLI